MTLAGQEKIMAQRKQRQALRGLKLASPDARPLLLLRRRQLEPMVG
jgi:hypothetical protein